MKRKIDDLFLMELLSFRARGWSLQDLASYYGISVKRIKRLLERAAQRMGDTDIGLENLRAVELARLDRLIKTMSEKAEEGDSRAARVVLEATRLRAELLGIKETADVHTKTQLMWKKIANQLKLFREVDIKEVVPEPEPIRALESPTLEAEIEEELSAWGNYDREE